MKTIPDDFVPYRTVGPFDQDSVPKGLLRDHNTKAGVWGRLDVGSGHVTYVITEPGFESEHELSSNRPAIIVPEQKHHLKLTCDVMFHITFFRARCAEQEAPTSS